MKIDLTPLESIPKIENQLTMIMEKLESNIDKRWLSTHELAEYTGYKLETIKAKIKNNDFLLGVHYYKPNSKLLFDKYEVDKWVMGNGVLILQNHSLNIVNEVLDSL